MMILGIDPGSRMTGYGLITKNHNHISHIDNGLVNCSKEPDLTNRLKLIFNHIKNMVTQFHPHCMAIENVFYAKNVQSSLKLGQARGVAVLVAGLYEMPLFEYSPREIKNAIAGFGGASKEQIQTMVQKILKLPDVAEQNASDALAVALCHAHSEKMNSVLRGK